MADAHVVPCDNRDHEESRTCWCDPDIERGCAFCDREEGCEQCTEGRVRTTAEAVPDDEPVVVVHHWLGDRERDDDNGPWVATEPDPDDEEPEPWR